MANMHLVTGFAGREHVTSDDQGAFHAAMLGKTFGGGQYVLDKGQKLTASIITNNQVRVLDGEILMQGRYIRLDPGTYVDLDVENGAQGYLRHDLIVARYTKNTITSVEEVNLAVIKGTPAESDPADPAYTNGDIINDGVLLNDMPLYRLTINGLTAESLTPLFTVFDGTIEDLKKTDATKQTKTESLTEGTELADADFFPFFDASKEKNQKVKWSKIKSLLSSYSKDEVLTTSTKVLYGLGVDAVPDDVLSEIGKYKQYWWRRRAPKTTGYIEEQNEASNYQLVNYNNTPVTYSYGDTISIDQSSGAISINNPISATFSLYGDFSGLKGKYAKRDNTFYFFPENAIFKSYKDDDTEYVYVNTSYTVTSKYVSGEAGSWQYIQSSDRNAYPDSGTQDGYEYEYLGVPFDNAVMAFTKIVTGSYIGNGGTNVTIDLGFTPKAVYVTDARGASFRYSSGVGRFCGGLALTDKPAKDNNRTIVAITENGFIVNRDSGTSPYVATNYDGDEYRYIALK